MNAPHCPSCGYDLLGLPSTSDEVRCPECGQGVSLASLLERMTQPSYTRELARVLAFPVCVTAAVLVSWGMEWVFVMFPGFFGAVLGGLLMVVTHLFEPKSRLDPRRRRQLRLAGLAAYAVMLVTTFLLTSLAISNV